MPKSVYKPWELWLYQAMGLTGLRPVYASALSSLGKFSKYVIQDQREAGSRLTEDLASLQLTPSTEKAHNL